MELRNSMTSAGTQSNLKEKWEIITYSTGNGLLRKHSKISNFAKLNFYFLLNSTECTTFQGTVPQNTKGMMSNPFVNL